jgi:hypothetical protein
MSNIMPDRVADLIPSQRPKPAAPPVTSAAVQWFSVKRRPAREAMAASQWEAAEKELTRPRPLDPGETRPDRETLRLQRVVADKVLSGVALRQSTAVLS